MTEKTRHTPKLVLDGENIRYSDGRWLVEFDNSTDKIEELEFIVRAVNSHEELLEALKYTDEWLAEGINQEGIDEILKRVRKAISKAEGRK